MSTEFVFTDAPPPAIVGRKANRKFQAVYDACQANPGKWTIWGENMNGGSIASMRQAYTGCQFVWRQSEPASNGRGCRGTIYGSFVGDEVAS